jgi:hypothetical protein
VSTERFCVRINRIYDTTDAGEAKAAERAFVSEEANKLVLLTDALKAIKT